MELISGKFRVVTPMFLGDAGRDDSSGPACADSIRGASVKGALRAAFRALNWSRIRAAHHSDEVALKALHHEEAELFGSAASENKSSGQARFLLRVKSQEKINPEENIRDVGRSAELEYLLGLGLFKGKMTRSHIPTGTEFSLELAIKPQMTSVQKEQLLDTLKLFGLLGNLGSRARKGFGSVSLLSLKDGDAELSLPATAEEYKAELKRLLGDSLVADLPPFTAFSQHSRIQISAVEKNALNLLKKHGFELGRYRGFGRSDSNGGEHKTFGKTSEANFRADHDWAYAVAKGKGTANLPKRAVFGLPHPYRLSMGADIKVDSSTERRASPLFAHVHQLPSGQCLLIHTLMKSVFLPESAEVKVKTRGHRDIYIKQINKQVDWSVIDTFLNRFNARDVIHG